MPWGGEYQPAPELDRSVTLLARAPIIVRINKAPDDCNARERRTGATGGFRLGGLGGANASGRRSIFGILISCSTSCIGDRTRTLFRGEDCGETTEENEFFLFLLGVRIKSSGKPS